MRCPQHGLALSPDGTCIRCRREEEQGAEEKAFAYGSKRRQVALAVVCAVVLVGGVGAWGWQRTLHAPPPVASPTATTPVRSTPVTAPPLAPLEQASVSPESAIRGGGTTSTPLERAMHNVPITLFCRPAPYCNQARSWLRDGNYIFRERNIEAEPAANATWKKIAPGGTVPAFDIAGQTFEGFDPERINGALSYAAARRLQR